MRWFVVIRYPDRQLDIIDFATRDLLTQFLAALPRMTEVVAVWTEGGSNE